MTTRSLRLLTLLAGTCLLAGGAAAAHAAPGSATAPQQRVCPIIPGTNNDPDTVTLTPPSKILGADRAVLYSVTADESPGEAEHIVTLAVVVTSSDGGTSSSTPLAGVASSALSPGNVGPATVTLTLAPDHHYTVNWVADFDFGIHPCASVEPGESAFDVAT